MVVTEQEKPKADLPPSSEIKMDIVFYIMSGYLSVLGGMLHLAGKEQSHKESILFDRSIGGALSL